VDGNARSTIAGDALVTFANRLDAERCVLERNQHVMHQRSISLFVYAC